MIEIYCKLIINKRRSFDKVPDEFKKAVKDRLIDLGYDVDGNKFKIRLREDMSIAAQHEIEHLNGILFFDHIDKNNPYKNADKYRGI